MYMCGSACSTAFSTFGIPSLIQFNMCVCVFSSFTYLYEIIFTCHKLKNGSSCFLCLMPRLLHPVNFLMIVLLQCRLNILAELLRFGDREFYKDWWNAKTFEEVVSLHTLFIYNNSNLSGR